MTVAARRVRVVSDKHLHRISWAPRGTNPPDLGTWPYTIPAVAQLIADGGWDVPAGVTFLVGENGSGKSTLVEAFAVYPRRGFDTSAPVSGARPQPEDSPLRWHLRAATHPLTALVIELSI